MGTVFSADGTAIGFDTWGDGPPLIMIDGATAYRAMSPTAAQVGALLRRDFRTFAYDRRGRGESGDTPPYAVRREIEDLAALIDEAGGPAFVCGFSSGAVLALDAAAAGLPITRLALFEPPFVVDDSRPPGPADYVERLDAAVAAGRPGDAVELFMTGAVGMPAEVLAGLLPSASLQAVEGAQHNVEADVLAPALRQFALTEQATKH